MADDERPWIYELVETDPAWKLAFRRIVADPWSRYVTGVDVANRVIGFVNWKGELAYQPVPRAVVYCGDVIAEVTEFGATIETKDAGAPIYGVSKLNKVRIAGLIIIDDPEKQP